MACRVPGQSYLAVLDALHDSTIRFIDARLEGDAAFMAEALGKLIGVPGICFATSGPALPMRRSSLTRLSKIGHYRAPCRALSIAGDYASKSATEIK